MPTPFPGMDPYLELGGLWTDVHTALIIAVRDDLAPRVRPRYRVAVEQRTYLELAFVPDEPTAIGRPDIMIVEGEQTTTPGDVASATVATPVTAELPAPERITERFLELRTVDTDDVITVIEILSPTNKRPGIGRQTYERKRNRVLASGTNLVEIDLLRAGNPMPMRLPSGASSDYRILISRPADRPKADVYPFGLRDPIPDVPIPLRPGDGEPTLELNRILHALYDRAGYDLAVDYSQPPASPLTDEDAAWLREEILEQP